LTHGLDAPNLDNPPREMIVIRQGNTAVRVDPDHVYFPFLSGQLTYDCISCGAQCCRGHGYALEASRELELHLTTATSLRFFVDRCHPKALSHVHVRNSAPCFFLNQQNLCDVELRHGYDAKPETCRLFPFNNFLRVGDYIVVGPHTAGICPLEVVAHGDSSRCSDHGALLNTMSAHGVSDVPDAFPIVSDASRAIELEKRVLAMSERHLERPDYLVFTAEQVAATNPLFSAAAERGSSLRDSLDDVRRFSEMMHQVLEAGDVDHSGHDQVLERAFVAMTPALRVPFVFPRRQKQRSHISLARVPYLLMALFGMTRFAREAGMRKVTLQTFQQLLEIDQPFLSMLAVLDCVMAWRPGAVIDLGFQGSAAWRADYAAIIKALLPKEQRRAQRPLGTILLDCLTCRGVDRVMFLRALGRQLAGQLVPLEDSGAAIREHLRTPRAAAKQWLLGYVEPAVLMRLAARRSNPTG
jgi:Fe-S-cluster containining protein